MYETIQALQKQVVKLKIRNAELLEALKGMRRLIENGTLVRDISKDDDMTYFIKQGVEINNTLLAAEQAIKGAE